uniref:Uncharacterized protein n=1 Tax=Arundo donax TaxID=35708 RepID=A0A0A9C950_ARUDO
MVHRLQPRRQSLRPPRFHFLPSCGSSWQSSRPRRRSCRQC